MTTGKHESNESGKRLECSENIFTLKCNLILILLMWNIRWANVGKWQM